MRRNPFSLSHDEVVHGKGSLINKMPGDDWQKFANLRLLYGYMYGHLGKKLLFMGQEIGQRDEWDHDRGLQWDLLEYDHHAQLQRWFKELNYMYKTEPALFTNDFRGDGFEWVDCLDAERGVVSFLRKSLNQKEEILIVCNFTPAPIQNYKVGVSQKGYWKEILNSDAKEYGGSGHGNMGGLDTSPLPYHGKYYSLSLSVPPLAVSFFKREES